MLNRQGEEWYSQGGDADAVMDNVPYATVGGGQGNTASGVSATVGGGETNTASGDGATVGGGSENIASGYQLSQEQATRIAALEAEKAALQGQLDDLEARVAALEQTPNTGQATTSSNGLPTLWPLSAGLPLLGLALGWRQEISRKVLEDALSPRPRGRCQRSHTAKVAPGTGL
jgi:hypothetical protein